MRLAIKEPANALKLPHNGRPLVGRLWQVTVDDNARRWVLSILLAVRCGSSAAKPEASARPRCRPGPEEDSVGGSNVWHLPQ